MTDANEVLLLTQEEAIKLIKRTERERARIALHVRMDAIVADKPDHVFPDGCTSMLRLSRADALRLVEGMLPKGLEDKGGRIRITRRTYMVLDTANTTYWIG